MKKSFAILIAMVLIVFSMSAMADSSDCSPVASPIYTDTGTSIR